MTTFKDRLVKAFPVFSQFLPSQTMTKSTIIAGGAAGDLTVSGIKLGDEIESVLNITTPSDLTSEFTITSDGTINNTGGTATTGLSLIVTWYQWVPR